MLHRGDASTSECLVLVGGYNEEGPLAEIWVYDLQRALWSEVMGGMANKGPLPRVDFSACLLGNKVYVFGGMEQDGRQALIYNDLWSFDLDSRQWVMLNEEAPVSERMGHVGIALGNDHLMIHGGDCLGNVFSDSWLYTVSTASWQCVSCPTQRDISEGKAPCARSSHSACYMVEQKFFVLFGGSVPMLQNNSGSTGAGLTESTHMNDLWLLDLSAGPEQIGKWSWTQVAAKARSTSRAESESENDSRDMDTNEGNGSGSDGDGGDDDEDDEDGEEVLYPSPRDLSAIMPFVYENTPSLLVCGGFGFREVTDNDEDGDANASASASKMIESENAETAGDIIEVGYLSDMWAIRLDGVSAEITPSLKFQNITVDPSIAAAVAAGAAPASNTNAWGAGGAKRGCQLVSTSRYGVFSFGGFSGDSFCGVLEKVVM